MKLHTSIVMDDCGERWFEVRLTDLTDAQLNKAFSIASERLGEIYAPLPVCGGDVNREEGWAWVSFRDFTIMIEEGSVAAHFQIQPETEEERMDPEHVHWVEPRDTLWLDALPFATTFGREIAAAH